MHACIHTGIQAYMHGRHYTDTDASPQYRDEETTGEFLHRWPHLGNSKFREAVDCLDYLRCQAMNRVNTSKTQGDFQVRS